MFFIKKALIALFVIPIVIIASIFIHEYGHALGAKIVGEDNFKVYIWPGYELTPNFGEPYKKSWPDNTVAFGFLVSKGDLNITLKEDLFAEVSSLPSLNMLSFETNYTPITKVQDGVIGVMGSALNLIISFISALIIFKFKPKGIWLFIAKCGAFLFYDILFYTLFPTFLDMPHLIFWGGTVAEPIVALSSLGVNSKVSVAVILLLSILQIQFMYKLFNRNAKLTKR